MNQATVLVRLSVMQGLLQRIQYEAGVHVGTDAPADDPAGEDIDHGGNVQPALPGGDVGEIRDPELVGALGLEFPIGAIQRARNRGVRSRGAHRPAASRAPQALTPHQALDRAARHL